ncbi:MAG: Holliday junction branch migration protein RuvA [Gammaproteobacteria bacterium]|nr:Holliday junction branch migration protein RuvA [Gammaproteobacteria bacterium]
MIGLLRGRILDKQPPQLLLDVHGIGYEVDAPMTTFYEMPAVGEEVTLFTHLVVREDAHTLYGFTKRTDRELFRNLLKVNGVGARLALAILSGMDTRVFISCVQAGDASTLVKLPGIGKKTAERLIIELRDRLELTAEAVTSAASVAAIPAASPVEDAVSALVGLGYKPQQASQMVRALKTANMSSEEIIRSALQTVVQ